MTQLPVPGATTPFWRTELHDLDNIRTTEELPTECDIVVIGTGYAGVSTVYHLLDDNEAKRPSVVMLEAREACSGASGRNGGHIKPDVYYNILKYTNKYGAEAAASFALFEAANVLAVKEMVEKEKIECDFVLTRAMDAYLDVEHAKATEDIYRELLRMGVADLTDIQFTGGDEAEKISGVKGAKCCFSYPAAALWPYKLVIGLLSNLVEEGVNVQTYTPVTSVSEAPDSEGNWTITTPRGSIRAKQIVFATNGYTAAIASQFHEKIVPVRGICSRIVVPSTSPQLLDHTYSIRYMKAQYDYLIQRPDRSIIVGGAKQPFWHDKTHWYGVVDDSKLIEPASGYFDGLMQRHFVGWEGSGAYTEMPGKPGQFINAGFSGHGMPIIYLASKALATVMKGRKLGDKDLPSIFKPTWERLESKKNEILGI
ncbi:FAD dependent oxidoreductase superfamily [Pseudomassariella vexata]|uniref:FAD dependent oxidoreductase superfamily n=1 Tax=Pseudomassariella vexata TaxID=1141098 RepID=A0A1Y2EAP7_9PEZI|nr:FAD dependent oxidoreductase superfamily [Pseudomassariella vexata]ORY68658.1 FAD dependent oxidoreductase superfamily [Pseudomassariella vexata]